MFIIKIIFFLAVVLQFIQMKFPQLWQNQIKNVLLRVGVLILFILFVIETLPEIGVAPTDLSDLALKLNYTDTYFLQEWELPLILTVNFISTFLFILSYFLFDIFKKVIVRIHQGRDLVVQHILVVRIQHLEQEQIWLFLEMQNDVLVLWLDSWDTVKVGLDKSFYFLWVWLLVIYLMPEVQADFTRFTDLLPQGLQVFMEFQIIVGFGIELAADFALLKKLVLYDQQESWDLEARE